MKVGIESDFIWDYGYGWIQLVHTYKVYRYEIWVLKRILDVRNLAPMFWAKVKLMIFSYVVWSGLYRIG